MPLIDATDRIAPGGRSSATTRALVRTRSRVSVADRPAPAPVAGDDVVVRVAYAGLCRTDVYVARGLIPAPDPIVLGHEFSGTVLETGPGAGHLSVGERVAVFPWIGCGGCAECRGGHPERCDDGQMLGVHRDGAFADAITVPARGVFPIPDDVPLAHAAYAEPVAAALAVVTTPIQAHNRILIVGDGRIARLTQGVLGLHGYARVERSARAPEGGGFDAVIETCADDLGAVCGAARPGGLVILKSRPPAPSAFPHELAVRRGLRLLGAAYAPFADAIALLPALGADLDRLLAPPAPLEEHARLFAAEEAGEDRKLMFELAGGA